MKEKIQIGRQIQGARRRSKISQEKLAELVGCSCKTISNIENGKIPELRQLVNICDVLNLSMDELFALGTQRRGTSQETVGYFTKRAPLNRIFSADDFQDLKWIIDHIQSLKSPQIKVLRQLIELW